MRLSRLIVALLILNSLLAGCSAAAPLEPPTPTAAPSPTAEPAVSVYLDPSIPPDWLDQAGLPADLVPATSASQADILLGLSTDAPQARMVIALAAPFATLSDEVSLTTLRNAWQTGESAGLPASSLLTAPQTRAWFTALWGEPSGYVKEAPAEEILQQAWDQNAWALLPFDQLDPRLKVLRVDGQSPIHPEFDPAKYALSLNFGPSGQTERGKAWLTTHAQVRFFTTSGNYDREKLTLLVMTGVTALVRGTAAMMEIKGMTYPAADIGEILRSADLTHISNEVPFAKNCPPPSPNTELVFCSKTKYIELLEDIGTDIVELTGDHFADWGPEAMMYTLSLYKERGWLYYGGGENLEEAQKALYIEHNGNRLAFIGCNAKPPGYATAAKNNPGAAHCDWEVMTQRIQEAKAAGYNPIVTFQHLEFYTYTPKAQLVEDFHKAADAGAVIVNGSQAHQPHAIEFYNGAFLHYGLGNLFFDQVGEGEPQRQAFIDRDVFYQNRHISTELIPIYFIDLARARPMTEAERINVLTLVFQASGWLNK